MVEPTPTRDEAVRELLQSNLIAPGLYATSTVFARGRAAMAAEALTLLASAPAPASGDIRSIVLDWYGMLDTEFSSSAETAADFRRQRDILLAALPASGRVDAVTPAMIEAAFSICTPEIRSEIGVVTMQRMIAAALASLSPAATPVSEAEPVREAAQALIASRSSTYKARNGRVMGIEDDSGEMMWIVPFDEMHALEAALAKPASSPAGGDVVEALNWTERQIRAAKQAMKESAALGNGYANFAAHDAHKHLTTIRAALSQSTSAGSAVGWQDIASAPKDGSMVLLFNKHHGEQCVMGWTTGVMEDVFEDGFWSDIGGKNAAITMSVNPSYFQFWRPLPEPPRASLATGAEGR